MASTPAMQTRKSKSVCRCASFSSTNEPGTSASVDQSTWSRSPSGSAAFKSAAAFAGVESTLLNSASCGVGARSVSGSATAPLVGTRAREFPPGLDFSRHASLPALTRCAHSPRSLPTLTRCAHSPRSLAALTPRAHSPRSLAALTPLTRCDPTPRPPQLSGVHPSPRRRGTGRGGGSGGGARESPDERFVQRPRGGESLSYATRDVRAKTGRPPTLPGPLRSRQCGHDFRGKQARATRQHHKGARADRADAS